MMNDYAIYPFPFGQLKIGYQDGAVTLLLRTSEPARSEGRTALTDRVFQQISEYLNGQRRDFDFPYLLRGTEFQQKVWQALQSIPYGNRRRRRESQGCPSCGYGQPSQSNFDRRAMPSSRRRQRTADGLWQRFGYERGAAPAGEESEPIE